MTSKAAQELGKKGGSAKSEAKTKAARANAAKPRGKWVTAIAYRGLTSDIRQLFGVALTRGKLTNGEAQFDEMCMQTKCWEWVECELVVRFERFV